MTHEVHEAKGRASGEDPRARPFVHAVAEQLAGHRGAPVDAAEIQALLERATVDGAADRLLAEPALLAACFGNVDLLYEHGSPRADRMSAIVMAALAKLEVAG